MYRFCEVTKGVHDTSENLEQALRQNNNEISPSTIFAMAAIDEGVSGKWVKYLLI